MQFKTLPLFATLAVAIAAPDPSPAPDANLVAQILERQVEASLPLVGATIANGT
jgi:hypothetical protein